MFNTAAEPTAEQLAKNLATVQSEITEAAGGRKVELVAVSKTKSPQCLKNLYDAGQRVFGENYVQEIVVKSPEMPADTIWHFIGHLQTNKVKELLESVPGLAVVESVDTEKLAKKLSDGCEKYRDKRALDVYIQVNTSGEESKSGTTPGDDTVNLAKTIQSSCPYLNLKGLMTIGMLDYTSKPENFICLTRCREEVAKAVNVDPLSLELSMGMSADYVNAIKMGSTLPSFPLLAPLSAGKLPAAAQEHLFYNDFVIPSVHEWQERMERNISANFPRNSYSEGVNHHRRTTFSSSSRFISPREMTAKRVVLILDGRTTDTISFDSLRREAVEQLLHCTHLYYLTNNLPSTSLLRLSAMLLQNNAVDHILRDVPYCDGASHSAHIIHELHRLLTRDSCPSSPELLRSLPLRMKPLLAAYAACTQMPPCTTLILVASTLLSHSDLFASFSMLESMERTLHLEDSKKRCSMLTHCIAVDAEAVCVTTANCGAVPADSESSRPVSVPPTQRLYRCSPDPCDIRFAIQSSLTSFLLPEQCVLAVLQLGSELDIRCVARRPYMADVRRCALPMDFPSAHQDHPGLCLLRGQAYTSPAEVPRGVAESPSALDGAVPLSRLSLEAVLSADAVDETFLYGDPWVLTPLGPDAAKLWHHSYRVFHNDVLLLRTSDALLLSPHRLAFQHHCFIAFYKDHLHLILRQVIPTELRREVLRTADAGSSIISDLALLDQLTRVRSSVLAHSRSAMSVPCLLSGSLEAVASQLTPDTCYTLDLRRISIQLTGPLIADDIFYVAAKGWLSIVRFGLSLKVPQRKKYIYIYRKCASLLPLNLLPRENIVVLTKVFFL
eukprot:gene9729-6817_t